MHLVTKKQIGSTVLLKLLRDGQEVDAEVFITAPQYLVPRYGGWDINPSYLICGGLVFVPMSKPWLREARMNSISDRFIGMIKEEGQQIVMLAKVLAHKVNFGYHNYGPQALHSFNGTAVKNLDHLRQLVEQNQEPLFEFSFIRITDDAESSAQAAVLVVLDAQKCKEATPEIFSQHMIQSASLLSDPCPRFIPK
eukprot:TRINITY_DN16861_c0_g1_i3.p1 TRINITY_DN16861_c0_g1~~TRINITY_DN16861_c0_g1_i3.p1  ORF type:complete len:195 (+),score=62.73 TRINITY_DN16861_c0_g1_i3:797-1381(+)